MFRNILKNSHNYLKIYILVLFIALSTYSIINGISSDTPPHVPEEELSWDIVYELLDNSTRLLRDSFPNTLIIPSLGNHDAFPQAQVSLAPSQYYSDILNKCQWDTLIKDPKQVEQFMEGMLIQVM